MVVVVGVVTAACTAEVGAVDCDGGDGDVTDFGGDYCSSVLCWWWQR